MIVSGLPARPRIKVQLNIDSQPVELYLEIPMHIVHPFELLPAFRSMAQQLCTHSLDKEQQAGRSPSCRAGCAHCCRYLVPISPLEARHIVQFIDSLPELRRQQIKDRFAEARRKVEAAGLIPELRHPELQPSRGPELGKDYHKLQIACPFLENESCSIYEERPIVCREHWVISDSDHCKTFGVPEVKAVRLPARGVGLRLAILEATPQAKERQWVPLILAPDFVQDYPEDPPSASGPELLHTVLSNFWNI